MKFKVLFIDDELGAIEAYRHFLEEKFTVLAAGSVPEALKILSEQDIAIVVTDMRMPDMDGSAFLKIANRAFRKPIKIVLSAYTREFFNDGFQTEHRPFAVLRKPIIDAAELMRVLTLAQEEYEFRYGREVEFESKDSASYLNAQEVLQRLGVSKPTLYKYLKAGLPSKRVGGRRLFDWNEIRSWIGSQPPLDQTP